MLLLKTALFAYWVVSLEAKNRFFTLPCDLKHLGIYSVNTRNLGDLIILQLTEIKTKVMFLPFMGDEAVVFPILHIVDLSKW